MTPKSAGSKLAAAIPALDQLRANPGTPDDDAVAENVTRFFARYGYPAQGAGLLVGLSGGPDSVALLANLVTRQPAHGWSIGAVHVNYGLRGGASEADHRSCRSLCRRWGVRFHSTRVQVPVKTAGLNIQSWARDVRYRFLERIADAFGYDAIAIGHHVDDRAESVAAAVLDAAGTFALSGIPPVRQRVIRPLFYCRRGEILDFLQRRSIPYRRDASNRSARYQRNRIRATILPEWEKENPAIVVGLARLGEQLWQQRRFLEHEAAEIVTKALRGRRQGRLILAAEVLDGYDAVLDPFVLRHLIERVGLAVVPTASTAARFADLRHGRGAARARVEQGDLIITRSKGQVAVAAKSVLSNSRPHTVPVKSGGAAASTLGAVGIATAVRTGIRDVQGHDDTREVFLDWASLKGDLSLRHPQRGDRYRPIGLSGSKTLADLLADRGVPVFARPDVVILGDRDGILWPVGHPIAERAKVTPQTRQVLHAWVVR